MSPSLGAFARLRRRLDRRFYRTLFDVYRVLAPSRRWAGPIDPSTLRRVLVVRHDRIGDAIVTSPLLSLLRAALPQAEIDVVASPANRVVFEGDPRIARIFVNDHRARSLPRLVRALRARRYDATFSVIYGRGIREGVLAALAASRTTHRLSVYRPARYAGLFSVSVRTPRSRVHMADRLLHFAARTLALPASSLPATTARYPMQLPRDAAADERAATLLAGFALDEFVLVNLWAAEGWRSWPAERFAATVAALRERGWTVPMLLAPPPGKGEEADAAAAAAGRGVHVAPPSHDLATFIALVRRASLVVTPDTAVVHVASACARPVVALYSTRTVDIARWQPLGVPHRSLVAPERGPVSTIPIERVVEAIESLAASQHSAR